MAPQGYKIIAADYSQIELRLIAHLSEDPVLKDAFIKGLDVHRATAAEVLGKPIEADTQKLNPLWSRSRAMPISMAT